MWVEKVETIEKVIACISDPWKVRVIAYLNHAPADLGDMADVLNARYSPNLGVAMLRMGKREINIFSTGKVSVREVDDKAEDIRLVNGLLGLYEHKKMLADEL